MKTTLRKITVLIPCYNEEDGIGHVIQAMPWDELKRLGFRAEVIVIDNNSRIILRRSHDRAALRSFTKQRKGKAMRFPPVSVR